MHHMTTTPVIASLDAFEQQSATAIQIENKTNKLKELKERIEELSIFHQTEILRILSKHNVCFNENKNGVFINITYLSDAILDEIEKYLQYVHAQEDQLNEVEQQKASLCKEFFL